MDKTRAMPILASAAIALSLTACQGMMGGKESQQSSSAQTSSRQTSSGQAASQSSRMASTEQQAMAPDMVRDIQRSLGAKGYDAGTPDGVYGASTEQALRKFQRDQKLNATGQVDAQTLAALGVTGGAATGSRSYTPTTQRQGAMAPHSSSRQTASAGPSREQVRSIQQNLADRGYDAGRVDGRWGPRTQQALRDFQRDQNLQASGRADPQTMAALGVESGSPSTQTGMTPEQRRAPPPSEQRGSVDLEQRDVENPGQQQGLLPPTGSQAPGSVREPERETVNPGQAPDMRPQPPEQQTLPPSETTR